MVALLQPTALAHLLKAVIPVIDENKSNPQGVRIAVEEE
jgi:hypothetical protein